MQLVYKNKWDCRAPKAVLAMTEGWIPAFAGMTERDNDKKVPGMT